MYKTIDQWSIKKVAVILPQLFLFVSTVLQPVWCINILFYFIIFQRSNIFRWRHTKFLPKFYSKAITRAKSYLISYFRDLQLTFFQKLFPSFQSHQPNKFRRTLTCYSH